jgi:hypothetical protein
MLTPLFSLRSVMLVIQLLLLSLVAISSARDAPRNLRNFYDAVRAKGRCSKELATGFYSREGGSNGTTSTQSPISTQLTHLPPQPSPTAATTSRPQASSTCKAATARSPTST